MEDILIVLRSFADYHQDHWQEKGIGCPHAAMRRAMDEIRTLRAELIEMGHELNDARSGTMPV